MNETNIICNELEVYVDSVITFLAIESGGWIIKDGIKTLRYPKNKEAVERLIFSKKAERHLSSKVKSTRNKLMTFIENNSLVIEEEIPIIDEEYSVEDKSWEEVYLKSQPVLIVITHLRKIKLDLNLSKKLVFERILKKE